MRVVESLELIHRPWLLRLTRQLARGEELRGYFEDLLSQFFNRLHQAVETGDPAWLEPVLGEWVQARTEEVNRRHDFSLTEVLNQIQLSTFEIARENLDDHDTLALIEALTPIFLHGSAYITRLELAQAIQDISWDLEKANSLLRRLEKSKSNFISIAAHELKTPLTLIEGYASMMRDQLVDRGEYYPANILLKGMDNGTRRLREIVDDMIDVSLIDNNLLELNFQPIWINRILNSLCREFEATITERSLIIDIIPFKGINDMTFGDNERLYQAFRNIFSNAVKYTPDGGRIKIDGRLLPGFLEVVFQDSGIGIDPENHLRIFEKFGSLGSVSLHSSGKTKFKGGGPGLGLPITKGILEAHGGSIWVESDGYDEAKCPGSTFHILLPIRATPPDERTARLFGTLREQPNEIKRIEPRLIEVDDEELG
jgi:signal transduction histidine kinase